MNKRTKNKLGKHLFIYLALCTLASACSKEPIKEIVPPSIKLSSAGIAIESVVETKSAASTIEIEVASDYAWDAVLSTPQPWIKLKRERAKNSFSVILQSENLDYTARVAEIVITSDKLTRTIKISQSANSHTKTATDSLALVAMYKALDGKYWTRNSKNIAWDLTKPIKTWSSITTELVDNQLRVVKIYLNSAELDGEIPAEISHLSALRSLDLRDNTIKGAIPKEIGDLSALEELMIDGNKFDGELPVSIANLKKLTTLSAKRNRFKTFPVGICSMESLKSIYLEENEISSLPGQITSLSKLEYIYLNNNKLTTLPDGLDKLPNLLYFHAQNNMIEALPETVGNMTKLLSLNLSSNKIKGSIPASITKLTRLKYLYLAKNSLTGTIPSGMEKLTDLTVIDLSNNSIEGTLPDFGLNKAIQEVMMTGNKLSADITTYFAACPELRYVMLSDNKLSGEIPASLADIKKTPKLSYLGLANNNLTGTVPVGFGAQLGKWQPSFNKQGFVLNGNRMSGELPGELFKAGFTPQSTAKTFFFSTNLYPQQEGFKFTNTI